MMDEVKRLLTEEIERINQEERRDNKIYFSLKFMHSHPYLFSAMLISYVPVAMILFYAPSFNNRAPDSNWNLSTRYNYQENSYFSDNYNYLSSNTDASVSMASW
ncbi:MAG: YlaC family protein [Candidatus Malihini olakiniferum]